MSNLIRRVLVLLGVGGLSSVAYAEQGIDALVGATVQFRFHSGFTVQAKYLAPDRMQWIAGSRSGTEKTSIAQVADGVLFISWLEDSGTTVSHVLSLRDKKVWSFVTYGAGERREARLDAGEWKVIEPAPSR